jgi:hypothetical protein
MAFIKKMDPALQKELEGKTIISAADIEAAKARIAGDVPYVVEWHVKNGLVVPVAVKENEAKSRPYKKVAKHVSEPAAIPQSKSNGKKGSSNELRANVLAYLDDNADAVKANKGDMVKKTAAKFDITTANARYYIDRVWGK